LNIERYKSKERVNLEQEILENKQWLWLKEINLKNKIFCELKLWGLMAFKHIIYCIQVMLCKRVVVQSVKIPVEGKKYMTSFFALKFMKHLLPETFLKYLLAWLNRMSFTKLSLTTRW
jgi:hypothetical protein